MRRYTGLQPRTKSGRRIADKALVNRGFCCSIDLDRIPLGRACEETFRTGVFDAFLGGYKIRLSPGRTDRSGSCSTRTRLAPSPRRAPPRLDPLVVCPGFESTGGEFFDPLGRKSKIEGGVLRSSKPNVEEPPHLQSSIFDPEDRRTPHLRSSAPMNGSRIGQKTERRGGAISSKIGGVLRRWEGFFDLPGPKTKNSPSSIFGIRRMTNLLFPLSTRRSKNPTFFFWPLSPRPITTSPSQLSWDLDLQPDLIPWRSVRRSRSALYSPPRLLPCRAPSRLTRSRCPSLKFERCIIIYIRWRVLGIRAWTYLISSTRPISTLNPIFASSIEIESSTILEFEKLRSRGSTIFGVARRRWGSLHFRRTLLSSNKSLSSNNPYLRRTNIIYLWRRFFLRRSLL